VGGGKKIRARDGFIALWTLLRCHMLYEGLHVLLLVCRSLEAVRKPFPLISDEPLEASTTVDEGSVKIEEHGLDVGSHLFYRHLRSALAREVSRGRVGLHGTRWPNVHRRR
jgi:hypothetical protein